MEGQTFRVGEKDVGPVAQAQTGGLDHPRRQIDAGELRARNLPQHELGECARAAAEIEQARRRVAERGARHLREHARVELSRMLPLHTGVVGRRLRVEGRPRAGAQQLGVLFVHLGAHRPFLSIEHCSIQLTEKGPGRTRGGIPYRALPPERNSARSARR